eukprot:CAMPEP_0113604038 /NCGR_PEP_ID=MMETSP0017_2-20120614/1588_1 /TAXON_ID=2856 /ORGANISM="Cylindrotheca closterium" /LENGTH=443 /DNA_ID=CAMNT_0000512449 /DNA_START=119 /DNA_END=1447 /DNA_ORIENTATION=+ /assembly_acc=CAM_ASM_000147
MKIDIGAIAFLVSMVPFTTAFLPSIQQPNQLSSLSKAPHNSFSLAPLRAADDDDEEEEEKKENPYADPNYPDLEFVNYDDPEYQVDQGVGDEFFDPESTEAQIEAMREERRMKNDEFQFETYYKDVLRNGAEFKGEWTVFQTSTFLPETNGEAEFPKLKKLGEPFKVYSKGERIEVEGDGEAEKFRLENQRVLHTERLFVASSSDDSAAPAVSDDIKAVQEEIVNTQYAPNEMKSGDFRGQQGNMCVGNGFTVATATSLKDGEPAGEGPYGEYRTELGVQKDDLRFRVKLEYAVRKVEKESMELPPLHLKTMTLCREAEGMWPRAENYKSAIESLTDIVFFGSAGANGGLYDPPPVGSEEQAGQYMLLDLEGGASLLVPYKMDQDPMVHGDMGWVTSFDWSPGPIRFQVDRKINGGSGILGLRTLELSEVQAADADTYRPKDG